MPLEYLNLLLGSCTQIQQGISVDEKKLLNNIKINFIIINNA